jgi:hypothetical protein
MSRKKRTSLEAIFGDPAEEARPPAASAAPVAHRGDPPPGQEPAGERPRRRTFEERHKKQSVYLAERVWEQLRKLAFDERRKMHDYLMDGLDAEFRKRGLPSISELEKKPEEENA